MNEIEKLYENTRILCLHPSGFCKYIGATCERCLFHKYQPFTAEKQIEIIKIIATNRIGGDYEYKYLSIDRDEVDGEWYLNLCIDGRKYYARDKDFAVALAKVVSTIWRELTNKEKEQIRGILNEL